MTLAAMERSGISFPAGEKRELEFARLIDALGDVGESGEIRRAAHKLFGRMYVPRPVNSHDALSDQSFQEYLKRLVTGLRHVALLRERVRTRHSEWYAECSGQAVRPQVFEALKPEMHPFRILQLPTKNTLGEAGPLRILASWKWWFPFRNPELVPIDEAWVARGANAYRRWEEKYGDVRWIEHLVPSLPARFPPGLVDLCASATGSKPSKRWLKALKAFADEQPEVSRSSILTMLRRLGSAETVRASEAAWSEASAYAYLHLEYRKSHRGGYNPATTSLPELHYLPWISEGRTVLHHVLPANPITPSEANTVFGRGLIWAATHWGDDELVEALTLVTGGAIQNLDRGENGPRMRSLALLNACVWSLETVGTAQARLALAALLRDATDARARRAITAAISS